MPMSARRAIRVPPRFIVLPPLRRTRVPNGGMANTDSIPRLKIADRSRRCFFAVLTANRCTALSHNSQNRVVRRACYSPVFSGELVPNAAARLEGNSGLIGGRLGERRDCDHRPDAMRNSMGVMQLVVLQLAPRKSRCIFACFYAGWSRPGCVSKGASAATNRHSHSEVGVGAWLPNASRRRWPAGHLREPAPHEGRKSWPTTTFLAETF
jgi:hypothetical protein